MLRGELPEGWDKDLPTYTQEDWPRHQKALQICLVALSPTCPS